VECLGCRGRSGGGVPADLLVAMPNVSTVVVAARASGALRAQAAVDIGLDQVAVPRGEVAGAQEGIEALRTFLGRAQTIWSATPVKCPNCPDE